MSGLEDEAAPVVVVARPLSPSRAPAPLVEDGFEESSAANGAERAPEMERPGRFLP